MYTRIPLCQQWTSLCILYIFQKRYIDILQAASFVNMKIYSLLLLLVLGGVGKVSILEVATFMLVVERQYTYLHNEYQFIAGTERYLCSG